MSSQSFVDELRLLAERRHRDPAEVLRRAREIKGESTDSETTATASWVAGLALHELGRHRDALTQYRSAVSTSVDQQLVATEALARASMAISLLSVGEVAASGREIARAREVAPDSARGVVELLYGVVLHWAGHLDTAMLAYQRSLRDLTRRGDKASIARLRVCRGILRAVLGDVDGALVDLDSGERVAAERDLPVIAAMAAHNSGFAFCRQGNLPDALSAFDRAGHAYREVANPDRLVAVLEADRGEVLLTAGLVDEARSAAATAVAALAGGDRTHLNECRVLLARAHLAASAFEAAASEASLAARSFRSAGRPAWAAQARYVEVQARVLSAQDRRAPPAGLLRRSRQIASDLEAAGWVVEAAHARTFAGRIALALGRPDTARAELALAAGARRRGSADLRAQAWHATALLRLAEGDRTGARRALGHGMSVVDRYRSTLGASELRARAAGHGADLARLGVRLGIEDGRPVEVLQWAERARAGTLSRPPVHPPDDGALASDLAELRLVRTEMRQAALGNGSARGLEARASAVEQRVRQRSLQARDATSARTGRVDHRAVRSALGRRMLVEYVASEGTLQAVTLGRRGARLHDLGSLAEVDRERKHLMFALRRMMVRASRASAQVTVDATASRLEKLLLEPLELPVGAALVVVPTGELHGMAWSALPALAGRPVTIAPSAALWLAAPQQSAPTAPASRRRVALVAGPGLPGAHEEVAALGAVYHTPTMLVGAEATVASVLKVFERCEVVHLAAHGTFRADSPLFSSVLLADGPLTVYDLERLRHAPSLVVLSACEAAVAAVHDGDELLGTAAALLALGVRCVVAPVMRVPDDTTTPLMVALHQRLQGGGAPEEALARARQGQDPVVGGAFVCVGRDA